MAKLRIAKTGGPVEPRQAPRADLSGAMSASQRALAGLADTALKVLERNRIRQESLDEKMKNARIASDASQAKADALVVMNDMTFRAKKVVDPEASVQGYGEEFKSWKESFLEELPDDVRPHVEPYIKQRHAYNNIEVREAAHQRTVNQGRASALDFNNQRMQAVAENPDETLNAKTDIEQNMEVSTAAGLFAPTEQERIIRTTFDQVDEAAVLFDIDDDPRIALARLTSLDEDQISEYPHLLPEKRARLTMQARRAVERLEADEARDAANAGRRQGQEIRDLTASNTSENKWRGFNLPGYVERMKGAGATDEEIERGLKKGRVWAKYAGIGDALKTAEFNKWPEIVGSRRRAGELEDVALGATEDEAHRWATQVASSMSKAFGNDPAAFILETTPPPEGSTPEDAISHVMAEYERRGAPPQLRKPLTNGQMVADVENYKGAKTIQEKKDVAAEIYGVHGVPGKYGEHSARAIQQLLIDGKMPWTANLMVTAKPHVAKALMRLEEEGLTDAILKETFTSEEIRGMKDDVNKSIQDWTSSLPPMVVQNAQYRKITQQLAFVLAMEPEIDDSEAGEEAVNQLFGPELYDYLHDGDHSTRVPMSVTADLRTRIPYHISNLKQDILQFDPIVGQLEPGQFRDNLMQNGYFLTNENENGATLYLGGAQVLSSKTGKPIGFKWDDAKDTAPAPREVAEAGERIEMIDGIKYIVRPDPRGDDLPPRFQPVGGAPLLPGISPRDPGFKIHGGFLNLSRGIPFLPDETGEE